MNLSVYIFTLAENPEDAKSKVLCFLEDHVDREFYDRFDIADPEKVLLINEIPSEEFEAAKKTVDQKLKEIEDNIVSCKEKGDRFGEGYYHCRYGSILQEYLSHDMPYYNMESFDWSIPDEAQETSCETNWYAVMVDIHY